MSDKALEALASWGKALVAMRRLKAERGDCQCEVAEPSVSDSETGYFERGVPACRNADVFAAGREWCGPCVKREAIHQRVIVAKRNERVARQRVQYHALKLGRAWAAKEGA